MADEEKKVESKEDSPTNRQDNSKQRRRSRSPINAPGGGRRGRWGRGSGRGGGRRFGGYRGFDRTADDVDNKTNSEEPHLKRARLFVGNLITENVTRRDLSQLFGQYGEVLGVSIHGGFAFVQMGRERDANRAIICEDNQTFKGSKIHVEFSQAAKQAGARRAQRSHSPPPSLPRERERDYVPQLPPPSLPPRLDEHRVSSEERFERLLVMEREMAYIQAREDLYSEMVTRSHLDTPSLYDHRREDGYRRPALSPPPSNPYSSRERSDRSGLDDRRPYYARSETSAMSYHGGAPESRSDQLLSYPIPRNRTGGGNRGEELLAGAYGGAATSGKSVGYGSGSAYNNSKSAASGGYSSYGKSSGASWQSPHDYQRGGPAGGGRGQYWN